MAYYYDADGDFYNLSMSKDYSQMLADEAAKGVYASPTLLKQYEDYHNAKVDYLGYNNSIPKSYVYNDSPDGSIVHNYVPTGSETYDPNVDYSALIAQEAAKGTGANRAQLAQWEMQRNAKIAGQGLGYDPTYKFSSPAASSDDDSGSSGGSGGGGGYYGGGYGGYIGSTVSANPEDAFYALPQVVALQDQYDKAKERLATDAAIDNKNLNEWFNAQGLNTGTAGQMQLANRNVKAEAEAELERELATQLAQIANETGYAQLIAQYKAQQAAQAQQPQGGFVGGYYPSGGGYGGGGGSSGGGGGRGSSSSGSSSGSGNTSTSVAYDPSVDYQALINEELAKGSGADAALLKQLEQQRNAKIAGEGITDYNQTNYYQNGYTPPSGSGGGSGGSGSGTTTSSSTNRRPVSGAGQNVAVPDSGYYGSDSSAPSRDYEILRSQLLSIPGLTETNILSMIEDAVNSHRISPAEGSSLKYYMGY